MPAPLRVLVAGAGIGGLAVAVALRRTGHDVHVVEQAERLAPVGAGLAISANALTALEALGLRKEAVARGALGRQVLLRTAEGRLLARFTLDPGEESLGIHRADLQDCLLGAAGRNSVRLGVRCTGVMQDARSVTVRLADGTEERGDVLVGADGIHSTVRTALFGSERPRYAGYAGWRATAKLAPDLIEPGVFWESWGRGVRIGFVDIGNGRAYWFVSEAVPEGAPEPADPKTSFLERFRGWHEPIPRVIEETPGEVLFRTFVYDRKPTRRWGDGRVTLLGDAAHAMTPNLGQGASQALEDAAVLGRTLATHDDPVAALRAYERRRIKRANAVVRLSRQVGLLAQASNPLVCAFRGVVVRALPDRVQKAQQVRLIRWSMDDA